MDKLPDNFLDVKMRAVGAAMAITRDIFPTTPEPSELAERYHPMRFRKLSHGEFEIRRRKMRCAEAASLRHTYLYGVSNTTIRFDKDVHFHELFSDRGMLTSDKPIEVYTQYIEFAHVTGHVLVGGLGLGMAAKMIAKLPGVTAVTVIEKERDLIKLVEPQLHDEKITVILDDLFEFLKTCVGVGSTKYDSAYYDIWYATGEGAWTQFVCPLYRLSRRCGIENLSAWGEHEMVSQLADALYTRAKLAEKWSNHFQPYWAFTKGLKKLTGFGLPLPDELEHKLLDTIKFFLTRPGDPRWEEAFSWDRYKH